MVSLIIQPVIIIKINFNIKIGYTCQQIYWVISRHIIMAMVWSPSFISVVKIIRLKRNFYFFFPLINKFLLNNK